MQPDAVELGPLRGPLERSRHHVGVDGLTITAVHDEPGVGPRLAADQASLGLLGAVPTSAAIVTGGIEISRRACGVFPSRTRTTAPSTSLHRSRRISDRRIPVVAARTSPTVQGPSAASRSRVAPAGVGIRSSRRPSRGGETAAAGFTWSSCQRTACPSAWEATRCALTVEAALAPLSLMSSSAACRWCGRSAASFTPPQRGISCSRASPSYRAHVVAPTRPRMCCNQRSR